jgi:tetratricopeptide (TPR) repeat protein
MTLLRLDRLKDADDAFGKSLQRNPLYASSLDGRAAVSLRTGEFESAAEHALNALERDMQLSSAHYHLGVALSFMDRPMEAVTALETAARLEPRRAAPYFWLSRIAQVQLGDDERAREYRGRAKSIIRRRRDVRHQRVTGT